MKKGLREILDNLVVGEISCPNCKGEGLVQFENEGKILCPKCGGGRATIPYTKDQAIAAILALVPKKKGRKIYFGEDCTSDKNKGYNQHHTDTLKNLGRSRR